MSALPLKADIGAAAKAATQSTNIGHWSAPGLGLRRLLLERVDVVQDRDLPQDHLADDVARFDVLGIDRGIASRAGWKGPGELGVVELDADDEWSSHHLSRCDRCA